MVSGRILLPKSQRYNIWPTLCKNDNSLTAASIPPPCCSCASRKALRKIDAFLIVGIGRNFPNANIQHLGLQVLQHSQIVFNPLTAVPRVPQVDLVLQFVLRSHCDPR